MKKKDVTISSDIMQEISLLMKVDNRDDTDDYICELLGKMIDIHKQMHHFCKICEDESDSSSESSNK